MTTTPPSVRLKIAAIRVLPGGTPEEPRAYYSLALESAEAGTVGPAGETSHGALTYMAPDGDTELLHLGDVVTLYLGEYAPEPEPPARSRASSASSSGQRKR